MTLEDLSPEQLEQFAAQLLGLQKLYGEEGADGS